VNLSRRDHPIDIFCDHLERVRNILKCQGWIADTIITTPKIYAVFTVNCDDILLGQTSNAPNDWQVR